MNRSIRTSYAVILAILMGWSDIVPATAAATVKNLSGSVTKTAKVTLVQTPEKYDRGEFHGLFWRPKTGRCSAAILCFHGASLWSGSFQQFADRMTQRGVAIYAVDLPGFGPYAKTDGKWTKVDLPKSLPGLKVVLDDIHQRCPTKPVFLLGESMGGCVAIRVGAMFPNEVSGIICSAPAWHVNNNKLTMALGFCAIVLKSNFLFDKAVNRVVQQGSDDPKMQARMLEGPQHRFQYSLSEVLRCSKFFRRTSTYAPKITDVPVMMVQGLNDHLVKPKGSAKLFDRIPANNKELVLVSQSEHLLFEEIKPQSDVVAVVADWIKAKSGVQCEEEKPNGILIGGDMSKAALGLFEQAGIDDPAMFNK